MEPADRVGQEAMLEQKWALGPLTLNFVTIFIANDPEHCQNVAVVGRGLVRLPSVVEADLFHGLIHVWVLRRLFFYRRASFRKS